MPMASRAALSSAAVKEQEIVGMTTPHRHGQTHQGRSKFARG